MHRAIDNIHEHAQILRDEHVPSDDRGFLTRPAQQVLEKSAGSHVCNTADVVYRAWADHEFNTGIDHTLLC